ncbi:MAG: hypothetical protein ABSC54_06570 [Smithellaceae bacterium]
MDTNPEASYKKQHIPGTVHLEIQRPEISKLDDKLKNDLLKVRYRWNVMLGTAVSAP